MDEEETPSLAQTMLFFEGIQRRRLKHLASCTLCGAVVDAVNYSTHARWHASVLREIEPARD